MKALIRNNQVIDIEKRDIDVYQYYHKNVADMFVDCTDDVSIGDIYEKGVFTKRAEMTESEV